MTLCLFAIVLGAVHAWAGRHAMNPDGISYLDLGDAAFRGGWSKFVNGYWSPLYPSLLGLAMFVVGPSANWEFPLVHFVNFLIYLFTLGCFHFFLREAILCQRKQTEVPWSSPLPEWAWLVLGYSLFIWSSLELITLAIVTPDMCVAASVYLAAGILLRINRGAANWATFALLGLVLGLGYLAKTVMFLTAFAFLGVTLFSVGKLRRAAPRIFVTVLVFIVVAGPLVASLSKSKGRWTFGDSGRLVYAWFLTDITSPTAEDTLQYRLRAAVNDTLKHPPRKISESPVIYEYGSPFESTYPLWYDASYWYDGTTIHFNAFTQAKLFLANAIFYFDLLFPPQIGLMTAFFILFAMSRSSWSASIKEVYWMLIVPALVGLGIYFPVYIEARYIAAFLVIMWVGIGLGVRLDDLQNRARLTWCACIAISASLMIPVGVHTIPMLSSAVRELVTPNLPSETKYQIVTGLQRMGVQPGTKVALVTRSPSASYWARLARIRIIAHTEQTESFWSDASARSNAMKTFVSIGVEAVIAEGKPDAARADGWARIPQTNYYAYRLE